MSIPIAIIGDYDPAFAPHQATDAALADAAGALGFDIASAWLPTASLDAPDALETLASFSGLWVAPGSPYQSMQGALRTIRFARENDVPLLGTCGGFQHIILEYARNVLGFADATHAEYDPYASHLFISRLSCSLVGRALEISLRPESLVARTYGTRAITEQYYCNFGVNPDYAALLTSADLAVVGSDAEGEVRVVELRSHPFFVGTLFVPQLRSQAKRPHPLVLAWLNAAAQRAHLAEHAETPVGKPMPLIRPATPADTDAVSALLQSAARRLIERGEGMWTLASLAPDCIRPDITCYRIAFVGGVPAGVVKVQTSDALFWPEITEDDSLFIHRLAVEPSFAGQGHARALLENVIREARLQKRRFVRMDCAADRPKLRRVYEQAGFRHHSDVHVEGHALARYEYEV